MSSDTENRYPDSQSHAPDADSSYVGGHHSRLKPEGLAEGLYRGDGKQHCVEHNCYA